MSTRSSGLEDAREGIRGVEWRRTSAHCAPTDSRPAGGPSWPTTPTTRCRNGGHSPRPRRPTTARSPTLTAAVAGSLVLFVQIATIWVTLQAAQARRRVRQATTAILVV